jgi:hypothetical protein
LELGAVGHDPPVLPGACVVFGKTLQDLEDASQRPLGDRDGADARAVGQDDVALGQPRRHELTDT